MTWLSLPPPPGVTKRGRADWQKLVDLVGKGLDASALEAALCERGRPDPGVEAAARVLSDLGLQGWSVRCHADGTASVRPPDEADDPENEKHRVRNQELLKRDEQLREPSVRRFIMRMETQREFDGALVSIFDLMRDGADLADVLAAATANGAPGSALSDAIDPYVQIVERGARDAFTGLHLTDVWRYFRHTWSNQYTTTPGRTMLLLVRDRAAPRHPVLGIAALSSAVVQIDERDRWIGWRPSDVVERLGARPSVKQARWLGGQLEKRMSALYTNDLVADELFWPGLWHEPTEQAVANLRVEAAARRADHQRLGRRRASDEPSRDSPDYWIQRAESDLYRSKRCLALSDLLRDKMALEPFLSPTPSGEGLREALLDREGRRAIGAIARRAKADTVGTEIADLSVCGALPPYNALIGGKLVAMLALGPTVTRAYHQRYRDYESEIASSLAGRPIKRVSRLVYVGTTSLYGTTSAQYNRVVIPAGVLGAKSDLRLRRLGRSRSFGTSHLSSATVAALVRVSQRSRNGARVNSMFGEGVNPKLRKVRGALDALGWPSNELLRHGRRRIVYGARLVENLPDYLLGMQVRPRYIYSTTMRDDVGRISTWWVDRWLRSRVRSASVLDDLRRHTVSHPVVHGARVPLPRDPLEGG